MYFACVYFPPCTVIALEDSESGLDLTLSTDQEENTGLPLCASARSHSSYQPRLRSLLFHILYMGFCYHSILSSDLYMLRYLATAWQTCCRPCSIGGICFVHRNQSKIVLCLLKSVIFRVINFTVSVPNIFGILI